MGVIRVYKKMCYKCHRPSFGSSNQGSWICPYCSEDLTKQRAFDAVIQQQINQSLHYKKQAISAYERNHMKFLSFD